MSRKIQLAVKRALDIVIAAVSLIVLAPLFAAIAVAIRLDSGGPALFKLRVAGKQGRPFELLKFRTMLRDARNIGHPFEVAVGDARITRVGRFLRRWSLDELPQLWNVIRGQMSIVGPRPTFVEVARRYFPEEQQRLAMYPGLTGWAQVHGRNLLSWPERVRYDLEYVRRFSLWLDMKILARTIPAVIRKHGVYSQDGSVRMHHPV